MGPLGIDHQQHKQEHRNQADNRKPTEEDILAGQDIGVSAFILSHNVTGSPNCADSIIRLARARCQMMDCRSVCRIQRSDASSLFAGVLRGVRTGVRDLLEDTLCVPGCQSENGLRAPVGCTICVSFPAAGAYVRRRFAFDLFPMIPWVFVRNRITARSRWSFNLSVHPTARAAHKCICVRSPKPGPSWSIVDAESRASVGPLGISARQAQNRTLTTMNVPTCGHQVWRPFIPASERYLKHNRRARTGQRDGVFHFELRERASVRSLV